MANKQVINQSVEHPNEQSADLTKMQSEIDLITQKWQRALADYQNLQKRMEANQAQFVKFANASLVQNLLVVVDDLYRAADHINDQGLHMVIKRLGDVFKEEGVRELDPKGDTFDANTMECVDTVSGEHDKVVKVLQKGYFLHDMLLRPAKVEVGAKDLGKQSNKINQKKS